MIMENLKKYLLVLLFLCGIGTVHAQVQNPVHWAYGLKHLSGNTYEVHLQATMDTGWHIYAQKQLPDAIAVPTKIVFAKAPGIVLSGTPAEIGKKEKFEIKEAGVTNMEYAGKVDFVQRLSLDPGIKAVKGMITYQTCTHEKCLTAETISFNVPVK